VSLILDALKKSEQERRRDQGPDLQTIHQPLPAVTAPKSRSAWWLGAVLIAVNGVALGIWWWQRGPQPSAQAAVQATAPVEERAATAPAHDNAPPENPAPQNETAAKPVQESAEFTRYAPADAPMAAASNTAPATTQARIQEISELPDSVRNTLPAMTFSFHVYSADPLKRTIIINNRRLREGDAVDAGITLQEITEDGVIIAMNQHRIHIGVLAGW
jgi:general secretion pathway protein B